MIDNKAHTLDPKEVSQLIKDGVDLENSGNHMYIMRLGWNNEMNKAADPAPFKIQKHLNEKLRNDALGMPYVVPPYGKSNHLRKRKDDKEPFTVQEQLEAVLKVQSDYAIGEIQGSLEYDSGNVWLIIDIWPEFQAGVERGYYPPLVSPTFNFIDIENGIVEDAQFLNLQGVPTSGYPSEYTQIQPVCKNGIKECMAEMVIHGSAGTLEQARKDGVSFSLPKNQESQSMEHDEVVKVVQEATPEIAKAVIPEVKKELEETIVKPLEELKAQVDKIVEMEETNAEVLKEVATKTEGVDEKKVKTKEGSDSSDPPADPPANPENPIAGAAGKQILNELKEIRSDYKVLKADKEKSDDKLKSAHIDSIVERKSRGKNLKPEEITKMKEDYMKMEIPVLETIDNELKAAIPEPSKEAGISGAYGNYTPESTTSDDSNRPKNSEMFA